MFYIIHFYMSQTWEQFNEHIINVYPSLLNNSIDFVEKENVLTSISADSFSISVHRDKEIYGIEKINVQYNGIFNCRFWIDIIRESPVWQDDLILVANDLLATFEGDFVLTSLGEVIVIQRKNKKLYVDENQLDYYPFDKLSQPWELKSLN